MIELRADVDQAEILQFVTDRIEGSPESVGTYVAAGLFRDGQLVGGVVYHNWHPLQRWCEVSCALDDRHALSRTTLRSVFAYPYHTLKAVRVQAETSADNSACQGFLRKLGFKLEGRRRRAWDGNADAMMYGMLRSDCRWLAQGGH